MSDEDDDTESARYARLAEEMSRRAFVAATYRTPRQWRAMVIEHARCCVHWLNKAAEARQE